LKVLNELLDCVKRYKGKKKPAKHEIEDVRKNTTQVINHLIEYGQRCELHDFTKMKAKIIYNGADGKEKIVDLFLTNPPYIVFDREIKRIEDESILTSPAEQFDKIINEQKGKPQKLSSKNLLALKKEFGDFDIIF
jgi:hypothetical protein